MNEVLQLKGTFKSDKYRGMVGAAGLPVGQKVEVKHIKSLTKQLKEILIFWENETLIGGALISVHYNRVVAKSNRIKALLKESGSNSNNSVRGARFEYVNGDMSNPRHVFTHFVSMDALSKSINLLEKVAQYIDKEYDGEVSDKDVQLINKNDVIGIPYKKTVVSQAIVDCFYINRFDIDKEPTRLEDDSIVTIYKTGVNTIELMNSIGINLLQIKMLDDTTFRLNKTEQQILISTMPYLIAMSVTNISEWSKDEVLENDEEAEIISIPEPSNEPIIGVIDTQFDEKVYFTKWVESHNLVDSLIEIRPEDKKHGTAISSIIVDGPNINPNLDDGCGRFRVRHFGVATSGRFSSISVLRNIEKIVKSNQDIKVWNLSLGSMLEIEENFISPEGAMLDQLQNQYDVIFVVAGTNKGMNSKESMKIGAPADSLNSIVVNAVDFEKQPASYGRVGPVLSFFHKPDVSYYGGDYKKGITVCEPTGQWFRVGTSYAAPWIARKMAYLINVMGLSREVAKALMIDAAAGWNRKDDCSLRVGFGVVPRRIEEILKTNEDEIKFVLSGSISDYETFTYNIPVPRDDKGFPYAARATLAYFPKCDRNQGVDYTCTELDIHFGRMKEENGKTSMVPINNNSQGDEGGKKLFESYARLMYRKWDNVKLVSEYLNPRAKSKKVYGAGMWGLMIRTKERLDIKSGKGMKFGVVITLKEINGVNRIQEFMNLCMVRGWLVSKINIENQNIIYNKAEEEIEWE